MNKIHTNIIKQESLDVLNFVQSHSSFSNFYLAGGTALSLLLGHRKSIDLDFFSPVSFYGTLVDEFNADTFYNFIEIAVSNNSVELIINDTKVFFWRYTYELVKPLVEVDGLRFANPVDIGLMKLLAIQSRNTKKDIIDLYFIDKYFLKLEDLLRLFEEVRSAERFSNIGSYKKLFDKQKLDMDEMPHLFEEVDWDVCLQIVTDKVSYHIRKSIV